jgi:alpha-1,3-mannosyltransferase
LDESAPTLIDWAKAFASDHASFKYILPTLLLFELILGIVIIKYVKYTEIDWIAYMQEVKGVLDGDLNYANLRGDTGPLVYPAGFVYVYMALYHLTDAGTNILRAQYIFLGVYLLITAAAAVVLHRTCVVPPYAICLISVSKRIHSIFLLRCFNDGIAMLLLYVAVLLFLSNRWSLGCFAFSAAVSIKMNVLLFAPGLLLLLWQRFGFFGAIPKLAICASLQLLLGAPFLLTFPQQYIHGAFDFGRVFQYVWTVNLRFLPEPVFVSKQLALGLLATQLVILAAFFSIRERRSGGISGVFMRALRGPATPAFAPAGKRAPADGAASQNLSPAWIVSGLFVSNFIGIVCARSLHYQVRLLHERYNSAFSPRPLISRSYGPLYN